MFYIGQKVVCIHDHNHNNDPEEIALGVVDPVLGQILSIREFCPSGGLRFNEIINPKLRYINGIGEASYYPQKFAPIITESQEWAEEQVNRLETEINEENLILK